MKYYLTYQLLVSSELTLPELSPAPNGQPDVSIRFIRSSDDFHIVTAPHSPGLHVLDDAIWLNIVNVAYFIIRGGSEIVIAPANEADEDCIRLFLLGSAFGVLLFQRNLLVMHGNSIRIGNHVVMCVGPSGIGKSTLATAFMKRGYDVLADDVVPINQDGNALPGFPRIKLWQDTADQFGINTKELKKIRPQTLKFNLPIRAMEQKALPLRWIYVLNRAPTEQVTINPVSGIKKLLLLHENTYRPQYVEKLDFRHQHMKLCYKLAKQIYMANLVRPETGFAVEDVVNSILIDIKKNT